MTQKPTALQVVDGADLTGKTCVITGASAGLGRESARALAATGAHVILTGRNAGALGETDRRLRDRGVRAYSVHPGVVATSLARHMTRADFTNLTNIKPANPGQQKIDVRRDFTMPEHGAATQVWAAVSPQLAYVGSMYLADCGIQQDVAPYAVDTEHATAQWGVSEKLCVPR